MPPGSAVNRFLGVLGPDRTKAERVALFAAAASVGPSFEPGLQPRRTIDQAIATGVIAAATLGAVTAAQSIIDGFGRRLVRGRADAASQGAQVAFGVGTNLLVAAACEGIARAIPAREDERARRGLLRVVAQRTSRVAIAGAALGASFGAADVVASTSPRNRWVGRIPIALPAGIAVSAYEIKRVHAEAKAAGDTTIDNVSTGKATGIALGVGTGLIALQAGERVIARGVSRSISKVAPSYDVVSNPIGHLVSLALLGGALTAGYEYAVRRVEHGGAAIEPAYEEPPASEFVSGGPGSVVPFDTMSREGRRFANMVLSRSEIEQVMQKPAVADPIRVFVGLDTAAEVEDRVDLVMDELVRTGAFDRDVLAFASPTGSGYINYVFAETLEYLTLGNSAIATMQYSMLPSSMSLTRTGLAIEQNRAIMHAITGYLRGMPEEKRPRFVLFGESLGALTMQDIFRHRAVEAMDRDFVSGAVFVGTPSGTEFAKAWRLEPERIDPQGRIVEVDNFGDILAMAPERRAAASIHLVSHYDDPIPKFGTNLLMRRPWWLGPAAERPPRVPHSATWRPGTTFVLTGIDLINAMSGVVPGTFGRRGHDYREDIPRFVAEAYDLPVTADEMLRVERALRARELEWAQKRVLGEQVARAKESIMREMKNWGVSSTGLDASGLSADAFIAQLLDRPVPTETETRPVPIA